MSLSIRFGLTPEPLASPDLTGPLSIAKPDWEVYCHKVADLIVSEQSPARVMEVRAKFYELLSHCIPPTVILKVIPFSFRYFLHPQKLFFLFPDSRRTRHREGGRCHKSRYYTLGSVLCQHTVLSSIFVALTSSPGSPHANWK